MSEPSAPNPVKLIFSLFSPEVNLIRPIIETLADQFGSIDWESPELFFDRTRYYEKEMGWPLHRRFISVEPLMPPDRLVDVKLKTNDLENDYRQGEKRRVNVDPGYISPERLILATGKNYVHRIYLGRGIYADLTLVFKKGRFETLSWTYPDYGSEEVRGWFQDVRSVYMEQLRNHWRSEFLDPQVKETESD